jgi:hypothetical protein
VLRYKPEVTLEEGLVNLASWLEKEQGNTIGRVPDARAELALRGLMVG